MDDPQAGRAQSMGLRVKVAQLDARERRLLRTCGQIDPNSLLLIPGEVVVAGHLVAKGLLEWDGGSRKVRITDAGRKALR